METGNCFLSWMSHIFYRAADRLKILIAINRTVPTCTRKW